MSWGGGWGNHAPETARIVAKAFYEGRACRRGNCRTDGETYWLENNPIARRVNLPMRVAAELEADAPIRWAWHREEFSFANWPTNMTARHLNALGVNASVRGRKNPVTMLSGKPCEYYRWYSREEIAALPPAPPPKPKREPKFINLTPDLFEACEP